MVTPFGNKARNINDLFGKIQFGNGYEYFYFTGCSWENSKKGLL